MRIPGGSTLFPKKLIFLSAGFFLLPSLSSAWDRHELLMAPILSELPADIAGNLEKNIPTPCAATDKVVYRDLMVTLLLNPESSVPPSAPAMGETAGALGMGTAQSVANGATTGCGATVPTTGLTYLRGGSIDDPDRGMDQNLATTKNSAYDPDGDQKWLGGSTGLTSQGFRHMYFGGWKPLHPLRTIQIPLRAIGQAPDRAEKIGIAAKDLLKSEGEKTAWSYRVIAWSMHYIQDLSQPFHSVQVPDVRMIPWSAAIAWPPQAGFGLLVQESTRTIANFHLAYEDYVHYLLDADPTSPFRECMKSPDKFSHLSFAADTSPSPRDIALAVANASIDLSPDFGPSVIAFFGEKLKQKEYNLPIHQGSIDYKDYSIRPDLVEARQKLHEITCKALANASLGSRALLKWFLR